MVGGLVGPNLESTLPTKPAPQSGLEPWTKGFLRPRSHLEAILPSPAGRLRATRRPRPLRAEWFPELSPATMSLSTRRRA